MAPLHYPSRMAFRKDGLGTHAVYSRNLGRAAAMFLGSPTGHLAHCAHYVDHSPVLRDFNVQRYLSAADAVGAWG